MIATVYVGSMRSVKDTISDSESEGDKTSPKPKQTSSPSTKTSPSTSAKRKKTMQIEDDGAPEAQEGTLINLKDSTFSPTLQAPKAERKKEDYAVCDTMALLVVLL